MWQKILALALVPAVLILGGCGSAKKDAAPAAKPAGAATAATSKPQGSLAGLQGKKVLVAYFSYSGNTRKLAETVHNKVGGDLFEITTVKPYPAKYDDCVEYAKKEKAEKGRPELKSKVANLQQYDVIFLGFPVWWYTLPMPVYSFLESNDFAGKTIVPFMTHGGGGEYNCFKDVANAAPKAKTLTGLCLPGGSVQNAGGDVDTWLKGLKF
jgi:flavodoxin